MRVLVTGGAGFIGSHVIDSLLAEPGKHQILNLDRLEPQVHGEPACDEAPWPAWSLAQREVRRAWSCLVEDNVEKLIRDFDPEVCVHLAAQVGVGQSATDPARYALHNAGGTGVLLGHLAKTSCRRLVVASSMSCYGEGAYLGAYLDEAGLPVRRPGLRPLAAMAEGRWEHEGLIPIGIPESAALVPASIYAETKATTERMALIWGEQHDIPTAALRFFNVYGPRQSLRNPYTGVCAIFAGRAMRGQPIRVYEDGLQTRDFVHVFDVAAAVRLLAVEESGECFHGPINVGTGTATPIKLLADQIADALGGSVEVTGEFRAGDVRHCIADASLLRSLGWAPSYDVCGRDLHLNGMRNLIDWLSKQPPDAASTTADADAELNAAGMLHRAGGAS